MIPNLTDYLEHTIPKLKNLTFRFIDFMIRS